MQVDPILWKDISGQNEAVRDYWFLNMFPYAPHLAFRITHYASTEFRIFTVGTGGGKVMGTDGNFRIVQKIKPARGFFKILLP